MPIHDPIRGTTAARIITHICSCIADHSRAPVATCGLPANAVHIPDARLILAATPLDAQLFERNAIRAAMATQYDVLLLGVGLHPEVLNAITVTIVTTEFGIALSELEMVLCRGAGGRLLVARQRGRSAYAITADGLVELPHAFADADDRADAANRFAAEIVRLLHARQ